MNKKQKKVLKRIIVAAVLLVIIGIAGSVVSIPKWLEFLFYLVPYFVIGYDILRKAWKGICNRQMFDENFLMAVQPSERSPSVITKSVLQLCCFIRSESCSRVMQSVRAAGISVI